MPVRHLITSQIEAFRVPLGPFLTACPSKASRIRAMLDHVQRLPRSG
jgi:hypothetical protein